MAVDTCLRITRHNRNSIAALLAVLEADLGLLDVRLIERIDDATPNGIVVYSFMTPQRDEVARELDGLQRRHGGTVQTIAGGPHASGAPEDTLRMGFRWVVPGEAGPAFSELIRDLRAGAVPPFGVLARSIRVDIDRYDPWPSSGRVFAQVELTRGCPIGCAFCQTPSLMGRTPRHRSLESIERLLAHAVRTDHRYTRFVSPNAFAFGSRDGRTPDPRSVEALLRMARRVGLRKVFFGTFPSEVRPESVTPSMLRLVRDLCDNRNLSVGLQSGSDDVLRRLRRGHTVRQGIDAVALMAGAGFVPRVDFIFGLPGESDDDRRRTRELIEHLTGTYGARIHAHLFTPLPGTPLALTRPQPIDAATRELVEALRGRGLATGHHTDPDRLSRHLSEYIRSKSKLEPPSKPCDASTR